MGQAVSMAAVYCVCSAGASLCQSCFGTTAPGTTGRKRSVLLLALAIVFALWFQYDVGPGIVTRKGWIWKLTSLPGTGKWVYNAWYEPCIEYQDDEHLLEQCAGNAGVYRPTFLAALYFGANAIATKMAPTLNREAWPAKYALYSFGLFLSLFVSSNLFSGFLLWMVRLGAAVFVFFQQIILIDVAYNWNDDWVGKADEADRLSYGSGSGWLQAIVGLCVAFYSSAVIGIGFLYGNYSDCAGNTWVITLTLLAIFAMTAIQLSGQEGSLLTSSVISLYAVYLCFSIVSKNPKHECNPRLGETDVWGITTGLLLTIVSMVWTGWSYSAEARLNVESVQSAKAMTPASRPSGEDGVNLDVPFLAAEDQPTSGLVTDESNAPESASLDHVWKLNIVMALISCYTAMILTNWGTLNGLDEHNNAANPTVGRINMAILGISQWLAILLYSWSLLAPRVFPDRDFS
eukprot:Nitzschia sp. Nitz4//scaffold117_size69655//49121//50500//NITZ4_006025-RA/size69655-processed-gene-0.28-mRNA-1//1//CDS//3329533654//7047//frame0